MDTNPAPLRRAIRAHLATRPAIAQSPATLHRYLGKEHDATIQAISDAADFLADLGHLRKEPDPLGGPVLYYQATAAGILAHERGE
jgi:hypothetical protein